MEKHTNLKDLKFNWSAPFVARDQRILDQITGGLVNAKTMANEDSRGTGPEGRVKFGRKVAYPTEAFIKWLTQKIHGIEEDRSEQPANKD